MNPFAFMFLLSALVFMRKNQVLIYFFLLVSFTACVKHYGHLINKITFSEKLIILALYVAFFGNAFRHKL